jgi:GDP-L-fucose synthase
MRVLITGGTGMLGSSLVRVGQDAGLEILSPTRSQLDLDDEVGTSQYIAAHSPDAIIHAAAKVGGIAANIAYPVEFLTQNIRIDSNVLGAALRLRVKKLIYVGSSCMYPRNLFHPMKEDEILTGPLESTNEGYALAKLVGSKTVQYVTQTKDLVWRNFIPSNLYGPNDQFEPERSHLLAAIIQKVISAKLKGLEKVEMWGDGSVRREFTYVDDVASYMIQSLGNLETLPVTMNIGAGIDHTVREYYEMVIKLLELDLKIVPDPSKPAGMKRKLMDVSLARSFGWEAKTEIESGIKATIDWYLSSLDRKVPIA